MQVTISGAAKVATTKKEFQELKAAQAKSDIRQKFAGGLGEVDPEVGFISPLACSGMDFYPLGSSIEFFICWANSGGFFICWGIPMDMFSSVANPLGLGFHIIRWGSWLGFLICRKKFPLHFLSVGSPFFPSFVLRPLKLSSIPPVASTPLPHVFFRRPRAVDCSLVLFYEVY